MTIAEHQVRQLRYVAAQLRHAYANLIGTPGMQGPPLTAEAAHEFARGLVAPQVRTLEAVLDEIEQNG